MKITPQNYKEAFQHALHLADPINEWISELPKPIQTWHEFILEITDSLRDWSAYSDEATRNSVDKYFTSLSEYIIQNEKSSSPATEKKREKPGKTVRPNHEALEGDVFELLTQFIPGLVSHLQNLRQEQEIEFKLRGFPIHVGLRKLSTKNTYELSFREEDTSEEKVEMWGEEAGGLIECFVVIDIVAETANVVDGYFTNEHRVLEDMLNSNFIDWVKSNLDKGVAVKIPGSSQKKYKQEVKAKKPTDASEKIENSSSRKYVEHVTEEVKFIKRYVALHNRVKSRSSILAFIKALQRSIVQKLIRKTSPFANEIRTMQEKLVDAYNKAKGDELKLSINEDDLSRLVKIAGGEDVYHSIKIIKRYVGLQGREIDPKTLESFSKQIQNAIKSMKVSQDDPYYDNVKAIQASLKKITKGNKVKIGKAELNGLEGILSGCGCRHNAKRGSNWQAGLGDISSAVLSAEQMANLEVDELEFTYPWNALLGKPARNFSMMFHGDPGSGKTTLLLKFVEYLANGFGRVLYLSSEEHGANTLIKKLNVLMPVRPSGLDFAANLHTPDLTQYDFIVLDSVNNLKLSIEDLKRLRKLHPQTAFIIVLQHTKDGTYRGGKDWEHETEVAVKVEHGVATVYRNRYGVFGSLNFFEYFNLTEDMFKQK